jgi:L-2,4-diaminobutyrate decarboxylase
MMLLPLPAGMLLVRDERDLQAAFAQRAPYLFHGDGGEARVRDQGVRSFQCSRRADVLKLWVVLQRLGRRGVAPSTITCATWRHGSRRARERREFVVLHEPQSNILCFRYVGDGSWTTSRWTRSTARSGSGTIVRALAGSRRTLLDGRRVLRVTMMNPRSTPEHCAGDGRGLLAVAKAVMTDRGKAGQP